jgi:hypothetical protein
MQSTPANVNPVKVFSVDGLSDIVVLAGPNGVGKTRLVEAILASFRSPNSFRGIGVQPKVQLIIEAVLPLEFFFTSI